MSTTSSCMSICVQRHSPDPPPYDVPEKKFGKVSLKNGDGSVVSSGTIVPIGKRSQTFGRITMSPTLMIRSEDGTTYEQKKWIEKHNGRVKHDSVYASDPAAAKAYSENFQKAFNSTTNTLPSTPRTLRQMPLTPVRRTVFGIPQPQLQHSSSSSELVPQPFKFDLPPLPPMVTPPRLIWKISHEKKTENKLKK